jgi:hypothetical protein
LNQNGIKQQKRAIRKTRKVCGGSFFYFSPLKGKIKAMKAEGRRKKEKRNGSRKNRTCEIKNLGGEKEKK